MHCGDVIAKYSLTIHFVLTVALFSIPSSATGKSCSGQGELAVTVVFTQNHTPYE